jgi:hypothetical protein
MLGALDQPVYALLDTGAEWSVVGGEWLREIAAQTEPTQTKLKMSMRLGVLEGALYRLRITLVADEGEDVVVEGTIFGAPGWSLEPVIGFRGCLERLRLAIEPPMDAESDGWLYFGRVSDMGRAPGG